MRRMAGPLSIDNTTVDSVAAAVTRTGAAAALGLGVGLAVALAAMGFVEALDWLNDRLLVSPYARARFSGSDATLALITLAGPALVGLLVGLLGATLPHRRGLTPADAVLAAQTGEPLPKQRHSAISTLAALLSLGCGASVGQYGPLVWMGAAMGGQATRLGIRGRDGRAIAIGCGVAAAIAAAFSAPIAGLVFAHEVVLRHYSMRAFAPVAIAAACGHVVATTVFHRQPLFLVSFEHVGQWWEYGLFGLLGLLSAGIAWALVSGVLGAGRLAARLHAPSYTRPMLAGLAVGLMALALPETLGTGRETLRFATIGGAFTAGELAALVVAKIGLTALCLGFGFIGGVFSPALLIGSLWGALFGMGAAAASPVPLSGVEPYAICGMMAVASAVIGAPLATILIVFELTRSYDLTIAAMVSVVLSNLAAHRLFGRSMFDRQLQGRGFDLSVGRDKALLSRRPLRAFVSQDYVAAAPGETAAGLRARMAERDRGEAMLVDADGNWLGIVRLARVLAAPGETPVGALAEPGVALAGEASLWEAMEGLRGYVGEAAAVVSAEGRLLGVAPESAVIAGALDTTAELRREENAGA
jgi:CIC family chloride channel protein